MNSNWKPIRLGDYCSKIGSGATPRGGDTVYQESGVSFIRSQNVYNGLFVTEGLTFLNDEQAAKLKGVTVQENDILLNITGDSVARCCQVPDSVLPARVNQHVAIIRPKPDSFDTRFVSYFMISPFMQSTMLSYAGSGGTRKAITKEMIENFEIPKPPIQVQKTIASILSTYDDLIENNRRRMALLEDAARQVYQEWFVRLRFPGHEHTRIVDGVPEGWERVSASEVININPKERVESGKKIWYVPMACLSETGMTVDTTGFEARTVHTSVKFRKDDVLLARITPCLENGKTAFVHFLEEDEVACGSTEFIVLRGLRVSPYFSYCLARSYDFRENAIKSMVGSSGRQRVQTSCFDKFTLGLPPRILLGQFDDAVKSSFEQIANLMKQNQKLRTARDLLLPKLMSGDIAV